MKSPLLHVMSKVILYAAVLIIALYCSSKLFENAVTKKTFQDVKKQILWNYKKYGCSDTVLLGDSIFNSNFSLDSSKSFHGRMEQLQHKEIFSGALNGIRNNDLLSEARLVNRYWPRNTIIIMDVTVATFASLNDQPAHVGKYDDYFRRLIPNVKSNSLSSTLVNKIIYHLCNRILLLKNKDMIVDYINFATEPLILCNNRLNKPNISVKQTWRGNELARKQLEHLKKVTDYSKPHEGFELIETINRELTANGNILVVVLTPLNKEMLLTLDNKEGVDIVKCYRNIHDDMVKYYDANDIKYIDLFDALTEDLFVDVLHPNEQGDLIMATTINNWLIQNRGATK